MVNARRSCALAVALVVALGVGAVGLGCGFSTEPIDEYRCDDISDCLTLEQCIEGFCVIPTAATPGLGTAGTGDDAADAGVTVPRDGSAGGSATTVDAGTLTASSSDAP